MIFPYLVCRRAYRMNPFSLGWYLPLLVNDLPGALQPSERGIALSTTEANTNATTSPQKRSRGAEKPSWQDLDARFRRDLPDEVYVGRLGFRGLVMRACPKLTVLDGVVVSDSEREKTGKLLKGLERSVNGASSKVPAAIEGGRRK